MSGSLPSNDDVVTPKIRFCVLLGDSRIGVNSEKNSVFADVTGDFSAIKGDGRGIAQAISIVHFQNYDHN